MTASQRQSSYARTTHPPVPGAAALRGGSGSTATKPMPMLSARIIKALSASLRETGGQRIRSAAGRPFSRFSGCLPVAGPGQRLCPLGRQARCANVWPGSNLYLATPMPRTLGASKPTAVWPIVRLSQPEPSVRSRRPRQCRNSVGTTRVPHAIPGLTSPHVPKQPPLTSRRRTGPPR